jgi:hypothetical protein
MTEYAQQQRRRSRDNGAPQQDSGRDVRNDELDTDVACCLDAINEVLNAEQAERDQAKAEFERLQMRSAPETELNLWQAKYAHLGLRYGWCCGMPKLIDDRAKS